MGICRLVGSHFRINIQGSGRKLQFQNILFNPVILLILCAVQLENLIRKYKIILMFHATVLGGFLVCC